MSFVCTNLQNGLLKGVAFVLQSVYVKVKMRYWGYFNFSLADKFWKVCDDKTTHKRNIKL